MGYRPAGVVRADLTNCVLLVAKEKAPFAAMGGTESSHELKQHRCGGKGAHMCFPLRIGPGRVRSGPGAELIDHRTCDIAPRLREEHLCAVSEYTNALFDSF